MSDFLSLLESEKTELYDRLYKLAQFQGTENFARLNAAHQILLEKQLQVMNEYHSILVVRLALLRS